MPLRHDRVRRSLVLTVTGLGLLAAVDPVTATRPVPAALTALLSAQGVTQRVTAWCQGEFREGRPGAFAVALEAADSGGTYVVIEPRTAIAALGTYVRKPSIDCYTGAGADKLDATIRRSTALHGRVTPRFKTSVVCAFSDETSATCWQYSPVDRAFVQIGQWIT